MLQLSLQEIAREFLCCALIALRDAGIKGPLGSVVDREVSEEELWLRVDEFAERVVMPLARQALVEGERSEWIDSLQFDTRAERFEGIAALAKFIPLGVGRQLLQVTLVVPKEWPNLLPAVAVPQESPAPPHKIDNAEYEAEEREAEDWAAMEEEASLDE
jgi:hypothetical protein